MENVAQESASLGWLNLNCKVIEPNKIFARNTKTLLHDLNGYFEYHTLNGLMGPSGAGKTTLLNCLSGNVPSSYILKDSKFFLNFDNTCSSSCFIEQNVHETVVTKLTVMEIFQYAYRFKNNVFHVGETVNQYIHDIVNELMIDKIVLSRYFESCSGGEQRRIAIGQELMSVQKPVFLFVDEPTTGLDSAAAFSVMNVLKQLALKYKMTIIASIHVPNQQTLNLFDKIYVLAKGGKCIYSDSPQNLQSFLQKEIYLTITEDKKPIEEIIRIACSDAKCVQKLSETCTQKEIEKISKFKEVLGPAQSKLKFTRKRFSFLDLFIDIFRQCKIVFVSEFRQLIFKFALSVITLLIFASFFSPNIVLPRGCSVLNQTNNPTDLNSECQNDFLKIHQNFCYLIIDLLFQGHVVIYMGTLTILVALKLFRHEHRNNWYSMGVFYWSSTLMSLLQITIFTTIFITTSYFVLSEHAADNYAFNIKRFVNYFACTWIFLIYSQSIGQLGGLVFKRLEFAFLFPTFGYIMMQMLNDFYFATDEIKDVLLVGVSNLLGMKYVVRYLIYTFYGIDRCDSNSEVSWILTKYHIDQDDIGFYIWRILQNVVVIRLVMFIYLYLKFNTFSCFDKSMNFIQRLIITRKVTNETEPIDYLSIESSDLSKIENTRKRNFDNFFQNKIIFAWRNLSLYGSSSLLEFNWKNTEVQNSKILQNLNGEFRFGTMNAVMGMSGSGKTSFLKVLNGGCQTRLADQTCFYISKYTKIVSSFITQDVSEHLFPGLTAKQILIYASMLKNSHTEKMQIDHQSIALNLLKEFDIENTENTQIELCSGGERKRLALALELTAIQMPNLICFDEPTSGLDSNSARKVISCFANLARNHNIAIICSIHQPTSEIMSMFDHLYLLARGGVCVYSGHASNILSHLMRIPEIVHKNCQYPMELIIEKSCAGYQDTIVAKLVHQNDQNLMSEEQLLTETQKVLHQITFNRTRFSLPVTYILFLRYFAYLKSYLWKEYIIVVSLYILYSYSIRVFFDPSIALESGCISADSDFSSTCNSAYATSLLSNLKYNFFMNHMFMMIVGIHPAFSMYREMNLFLNEHRNGWYSSGCFYVMKSLLDILPLIPLIPIYVYICNIYEVVQPGIYWYLVLIISINAIALIAMAYIVVYVSNGNVIMAAINVICVIYILLLLSNFYTDLKSLNYVYQFLSNFSILRFTLDALVLLEYGFGRCAEREIQPILYSMQLHDDDLHYLLMMLMFNMVLYIGLAFYMLTLRSNRTENRKERNIRILNHSNGFQSSTTAMAGLSCSPQSFCLKQIKTQQ